MNAKLVKIVSLAEEQFLLKRNDCLNSRLKIDTNIYYVEQGALVLYVLDDQGQKQVIRLAYKENFIVFLDAFFMGKPSCIHIEAIKQTKLKVIKKTDLNRYLEQNLIYNQVWLEFLEELLVQQLEREIDLLTSSAVVRYSRVLKRSPQLFQEIPNKYIANYLRMSPETLSRLKKS